MILKSGGGSYTVNGETYLKGHDNWREAEKMIILLIKWVTKIYHLFSVPFRFL